MVLTPRLGKRRGPQRQGESYDAAGRDSDPGCRVARRHRLTLAADTPRRRAPRAVNGMTASSPPRRRPPTAPLAAARPPVPSWKTRMDGNAKSFPLREGCDVGTTLVYKPDTLPGGMNLIRPAPARPSTGSHSQTSRPLVRAAPTAALRRFHSDRPERSKPIPLTRNVSGRRLDG